MLNNRPLTPIESQTPAKLIIATFGLCAALFVSELAPAYSQYIFILSAIGILMVLPTNVQFFILLIALNLPPGFSYTTRHIVAIDVQLQDVLIIVLTGKAFFAWINRSIKIDRSIVRWVIILSAFLLWTGLAQVMAYMRAEPMLESSWSGWARAMSFLLLVPIFGIMTLRENRLNRFINIALWIAVAQCLIAITIKYFGPEIGISREFIELISGAKGAAKYGSAAYPVTGFLGSGADIGVTMSVLVCFALSKWISGSDARRGILRSGIPSIVLMVVSIVLSLSRRAMVGGFVGAFVVYLLSGQRSMIRIGLTIIGGMVGIVLLGPAIANRFGPAFATPGAGELTSLGYRLVYWGDALPLILDNPLLGLGWGGFGVAQGLPNTFSHSLYTEAAVAFGIPCLVLIFISYWFVFKDANILRRRRNSSGWLGIGMIGALTAIMLASIVDEVLFNSQGRFFWTMAGLQLCAVRIQNMRESETSSAVNENPIGSGNELIFRPGGSSTKVAEGKPN